MPRHDPNAIAVAVFAAFVFMDRYPRGGAVDGHTGRRASRTPTGSKDAAPAAPAIGRTARRAATAAATPNDNHGRRWTSTDDHGSATSTDARQRTVADEPRMIS